MTGHLECPGCAQQELDASHHTTSCPAYTGHAVKVVAHPFIGCQCGHLSVNKVDRQAHIDQIKREASKQ
jgi:C4-type Zn-finger protein